MQLHKKRGKKQNENTAQQKIDQYIFHFAWYSKNETKIVANIFEVYMCVCVWGSLWAYVWLSFLWIWTEMLLLFSKTTREKEQMNGKNKRKFSTIRKKLTTRPKENGEEWIVDANGAR